MSEVPKSKLQLKFIIVGAGLGGLAAAIGLTLAGHHVVVLEQAPKLAEVGAGIQIPPNSTKILEVFGCKDTILANSTLPRAYHFYNYKGKNLINTDLYPYTVKKYGSEYLHIHRADFHKCLVARAEELGIELILNTHVSTVDFDANEVVSIDGRKFFGDVIIGADGLRSKVRCAMLGRDDPPHMTGDLAFRALISISEMKKYPELEYIFKEPCINFYWGPHMHVVIYLLKGGDTCNVVVLAPDNLPAEVNVVEAQDGELEEMFKDWDPRLLRLLSLARESSKWRLQNSVEMETWSHPTANVTLLGDACHATLPYLAQGAAQAVEDAGALAYLFGKIEDKKQIHTILKTYENMRKWRTTQIVQGSTACQGIFHLPDGEAQIKRDALCALDPPQEGCPARWADPVFQEFLFGYDVFAESEKAWREL